MTKKQLHALKVKAGKMGGSATSAAKRKAARLNGAKGGRKRIVNLPTYDDWGGGNGPEF